MAGIYFHIPFCKRICSYCDFPRSADLRLTAPVAEALHHELDERNNYLHDRSIRTIYFGGGTPSLYAPDVLQGLIDHARSLYGFNRPDEITVECNPDDLTAEYLRRLRTTEIDRLSVGIQSFDDACLRLMNRRHTAEEAVKAIRRAQDAGFENITIDLIFGVRGFGEKKLHQTLETALSLNVQHISAYHLTIESNTALGRRTARGEFGPVDEEVSEQEFTQVHETLSTNGFEHYEVSNYARKGFRARHNAAYWSGEEYLGIGPGAHSFNGTERRWCLPDVKQYSLAPAYESEDLTIRDRFNEYVMTGLRTAEGVDLDLLEQRFGKNRRLKVLDDAHPHFEAGSLRLDGNHMHIPASGFLISDAVIGTLFEV